MKSQTERRIDPDPVSVGMAILSAMANVTTVAVYLEHLRRQRLVERRRRIRLRTKAALRRLHNDLTHLRASAENVFRMIPLNSRESLFRFGYAPVFLDLRSFDIYSEEYQDILERITIIQRHIHQITIDLLNWPDGSLDLPVGELREANSTANRLLEERLTIAEAFREIRDLIEKTTDQISAIDDFLSEFPNA